MKLQTLYFLITILIITACDNPPETPKTQHPNIIYILADDLGYGDISAYNPDSKVNTTHVDALAQQGMMFTDAHTNSSVCSPTRYGILTGRYAWRTHMKKSVFYGVGAIRLFLPPEPR